MKSSICRLESVINCTALSRGEHIRGIGTNRAFEGISLHIPFDFTLPGGNDEITARCPERTHE